MTREDHLAAVRSEIEKVLRKDVLDEGWRHVDWEKTPFVGCDEACFALREPETSDEILAALRHWKEHHWLAGCSHAKV